MKIKDEALDSQKYELEKIIKRILDIFISIIGIALLIPVTIIIFFAKIFLKDKGSIIYSQNRIGKDGKIFKMYKYRSMIVGADEKLEEILTTNEELKDEYKLFKKLRNDPRVTKIGKFIRKTNIDELPQFINVFKGDMSVVGPRPYLEREIKDMGDAYNDIIKCKPGLTGVWQVNAEQKKEFGQRVSLEKDYVKNNNLLLDMKLFLKTIKKMYKFNNYKSNQKI